MYLLVILFFGSLAGIVFMIGRKLMVMQDGAMVHHENIFKDSYLEDLKRSLIKNSKKYSYIGVVATVRFYVHSTNFLKNKYGEVKIKIKELYQKKSKKEVTEKREVSGFLKMISEYKHKLRKIKKQIKEEENL